MSVAAISASAPEGFYSPLEGKSGTALFEAVRNLAAGHKVITYNTKTWGAFEKTDVREINGRQSWFDMYSNNIVYLPEHASLNIEHSVANSWWGGKKGSTEAYSDLFHLNPSDQNANNKKGSYPPGRVLDARILDNGLFRIGTPFEGMGGGATSVFEPAEEYKGDFARAYFYIFSAYPDLAWEEQYAYVYTPGGTLQPWAATELLMWNYLDPVDSREMKRNDEIEALQGNRNPFIDDPTLGEYLWGALESKAYTHTPVVPVDRPEAPVFDNCRMSNLNTYSAYWWDGYDQNISHEGELYLSIDGRLMFDASDFTLTVDAADKHGETHTYTACVIDPVTRLKSPDATLKIRASDPVETDYARYEWEPYTAFDGITFEEKEFILLSASGLHTLSTDGGTTAKAFMESSGFCDFNGEGRVTQVPEGTAVVKFIPLDGSAKFAISLHDLNGDAIGYWNAPEARKMRLDPVTYTPGTPSIDGEGNFSFDFGEAGKLQFNESQPRFLSYTSSQKPVRLYSCAGTPSTVKETVAKPGIGIEGNSLILPAGARAFDLQGRPVNPDCLSGGIYLVVAEGRTVKVIL